MCKGPRKRLCSKLENFKNITTLLWSNITKNTPVRPKPIPARPSRKYILPLLADTNKAPNPPSSHRSRAKEAHSKAELSQPSKNYNQGRILKAARDR